jgi:hypothetical protein
MPDVFVTPNKKPADATPQLDTKQTEKLSENNPPKKPFTRLLGMLTTFRRNPGGVELVGQNHDEEVLLFLRQDFITNFTWIFNTVLFALLPLILNPLFDLANLSLNFLPFQFIILLTIFYYFLLIGYAFANFLTWYYTIGIITSKKFIDIDFQNLSSIHVGTVNLKDASDVKYKQSGFFQSFFDYGDIIITIEATKEQFIFEKTPRPAYITDLLSDQIGKS